MLQYAVGSPRNTVSRSSMNISANNGDEPVTTEELDELLKGLTSLGDIDDRYAADCIL